MNRIGTRLGKLNISALLYSLAALFASSVSSAPAETPLPTVAPLTESADSTRVLFPEIRVPPKNVPSPSDRPYCRYCVSFSPMYFPGNIDVESVVFSRTGNFKGIRDPDLANILTMLSGSAFICLGNRSVSITTPLGTFELPKRSATLIRVFPDEVILANLSSKSPLSFSPVTSPENTIPIFFEQEIAIKNTLYTESDTEDDSAAREQPINLQMTKRKIDSTALLANEIERYGGGGTDRLEKLQHRIAILRLSAQKTPIPKPLQHY